MSFQISFENDRLHNPYSQAQDLLSSLGPWPAADLKAAFIQAAHKVSELRGAHIKIFLQLLEGL
jgi:hypothetical protein